MTRTQFDPNRRVEISLYVLIFLLTFEKLYFEWLQFIGSLPEPNPNDGEAEQLIRQTALGRFFLRLRGYFFGDLWNVMDMIVYSLVLLTMSLTVAREVRIANINPATPVHLARPEGPNRAVLRG